MSVGTEGSSPNPRTYSRAEYAALEAENARLVAEVEELDDLRKRQSELLSAAAIAIRGPEPALTRYSHADIPERVKMVVAERDAARAQLAAIQGGMGEVVEDWGWLANLYLAEVECCCPWNPDGHDKSCPVYLRDRLSDAKRAIAQHQRITAAMAAEVEWWERNFRDIHEPALREAHAYIQELRAELAISRADERCAMGYLSEVRSIVGGDDFPAMAERVRLMAAQLAEVKGREALEAIADCTDDDQARNCALIALAASTGQVVLSGG